MVLRAAKTPHPYSSSRTPHHRSLRPPPILPLAKASTTVAYTTAYGYRPSTTRTPPHFSPPEDTSDCSLFHIYTHLFIYRPPHTAPQGIRRKHLHLPPSPHILPTVRAEAQTRTVLRGQDQSTIESLKYLQALPVPSTPGRDPSVDPDVRADLRPRESQRTHGRVQSCHGQTIHYFTMTTLRCVPLQMPQAPREREGSATQLLPATSSVRRGPSRAMRPFLCHARQTF